MADSKWIIMCSSLLSVLCNCQERSLLNLEETGIISCPSDNFVAVPADIVRMQAGEPDKEICLDPNYIPYTFPFYLTVSCESQFPRLSRQLLMSREDIQLFQGIGGEFCLENRNSSDGNDQLLLGINLAGVSREKLQFSLTLVCRGVGTPGSGGSDVETTALIEPRNTTSLRFIPLGQNGNVTTEKGKRVKIAVLEALPDELENVTSLWSDSRIVCGPDADIEVPKCVYTSQLGMQVTWSCSVTADISHVYIFNHRGTLNVVRLTVHNSNSTDLSPSFPPQVHYSISTDPSPSFPPQVHNSNSTDPSLPPPPQDLIFAMAVVLTMILAVCTIGIPIFVIATWCYRRLYDPLKDVRDNVQDAIHQLARHNVEYGRLDTQSEPSHDCTSLESPNQPSYVSLDVNPDDHRCSITDLNIDEAAISNNGHTHMTDDRGSTELPRCQYKPFSKTATRQPSSTVRGDSSGITRVTSDKWWVLGEAHTIVVTSCGGEWSLSPFSGKKGGETSCAVLTAPSGVVEEGTELPVEYCVILDGPFTLPSNYVRVSMALYLNCDETLLRKPLKVKLCHWAAPDENDSHFSERLSFLKAPHALVEGQDSHHFEQIEGAEFYTSTSTGILSLKDHFCLICIACERSGPQEERVNKRCYAMLWEGEVEDSKQQFRIVVMYAVPSWKQATREHYLSEKKERFKYSEVREFVFTKDCLLHLGIAEDKGNDWMLLQLKTMLYQEDLSLSKFAEKECKEKIDEVESGLYPPAMIFDVGYELPPSKESRIKLLKASLHGVKNEINFSFPVLENPKMCFCSTEQREFYGKRKKRKVGSDILKKYQLDQVILEDFVIAKMADKWREFGIRLGIQNAMLDSIFKSKFGDTVDCCRGVLYRWMSSNGDEVSWDKVIQVMKDCERILQASELEDHLSGK